MKLIQLGGNRYKNKPIRAYTMVDDDVFDYLNKFSWYINKGYAYRNIKQKDGKYKAFKMSRLLTNAKDGEIIDHIDRNKLNNQLSNLRVATKSTNAVNSGVCVSNTSGYKGVHFDKYANKWRAEIHFQSKHIRLGRFSDLKDAVLAYNNKAKELFGEFAYINTI